MRIKICSFFLVGLLALSSCIDPDKITFDGVESTQLRGVSTSQVGVDLNLRMTNASGRNINLTSADFVLKKGDATLMKIQLREPVQLHRKSSGLVVVPLSVRFEGFLGALTAASVLSTGFEGCTIEGDAMLRSGMMKKRVTLPALPLEGVVKASGIDPSQLLKLQ